METLVTADWLSHHLDDPDLVVLDCSVDQQPDEGGGFRYVSARPAYDDGHIPSAGFADLTGDLSDHDSPLDLALPTPEQFCAAMGALGVGPESRVVLYDGASSVWAARVWWMLRWVGVDRAAILDGGLGVWTAEGRPLSTDPAQPPARELTADPRPRLIADRDEVFAAVGDDDVHLLDAMPAEHYRGEMALYDRPGHVPGASNLSAFELVDGSGRYRPLPELGAVVDRDRDVRTITYCGVGVVASSVAFVLARLGFADVAVYAASLQEWAADPANPLTVDPGC